ncbi:MAG: ribosome assembly cofactor RimP [Spirochaetaceae bacterium]|jgi:ribosome maturation factor RimP|nr:ribosome assembly cofactor RimP [Spirochaetaceae bacterium]
MQWTARKENPLFDSLTAIVQGLGFTLIDLSVSPHKGNVQVRAIIYKNGMKIGTDDCTRIHRAIMPHLALTFPTQGIYVEVSSPGINRLIKDASEFVCFLGRGIKCYRKDISDWTRGIIESADEKAVVIKGKEGMLTVKYALIAKAQLDWTEEV